MAIVEYYSRPTHDRIMKKSKSDIAHECLSWMEFSGRQTDMLEKVWKALKSAKDILEHVPVSQNSTNETIKLCNRYKQAMKDLNVSDHAWNGIHTEIDGE